MGSHRHEKGQSILEFSFCIIIVVVLIQALIVIFKWSSLDYPERRIAHDQSLVTSIPDNWYSPSAGPLRQLDPDFFESSNELRFFGGE